MYNEDRDDGLSWVGGRPARSLLVSWKDLLEKLGPLMHQAGKVIFVNNHDKRIDLLRRTDGFFDEFTYGGAPLNLTALMGVRRPVLGWTAEEKNLRPDPDAFFQSTYILRFPDAPSPGTTIRSAGRVVDRQYLAYGPPCSALSREEMGARAALRRRLWCDGQGQPFRGGGGWLVPVTSPKEEDQRHPPQRAGLREARSGSLLSGTEETERVTLEDAAGR